MIIGEAVVGSTMRMARPARFFERVTSPDLDLVAGIAAGAPKSVLRNFMNPDVNTVITFVIACIS
jgi:hypothetical protein